MTKINSIDQLEFELKKLALSSMKSIGIEGEKELKESVEEEVYDSYMQKYYKRTGDLKRSVTHAINERRNSVSVKIYHNYDKMRQLPPSMTYRIGTHHSTVRKYSPQKYARYLPETIESGTSGKIFGSGAWTQPRRYFSKFVSMMENNFEDMFLDKLKKKGLNVRKVGA